MSLEMQKYQLLLFQRNCTLHVKFYSRVESSLGRNIRLEMFCKRGVLKNVATLTGKHLCWNLFLIKLHALQHRFYPMNFTKFVKAFSLEIICKRLLLTVRISFFIVQIFLDFLVEKKQIKQLKRFNYKFINI